MTPTITTTSQQPYTSPLGNGTFTTTVTVRQDTNHSCCRQITATFSLQLTVAGTTQQQPSNEVGHLIANIVDKTAKVRGKPLWISQLCKNKDNSEVSQQSRALFTANGARRPAVRDLAEQLKGDRLVHVETFKIKAQYRNGQGFGRLAIDAFHAILPLLNGGDAYSGTVLLAPGMPLDCRDDYPKMDDEKAARRLQGVYAGYGYTVFVDDYAANVRDYIIVMGKIV